MVGHEGGRPKCQHETEAEVTARPCPRAAAKAGHLLGGLNCTGGPVPGSALWLPPACCPASQRSALTFPLPIPQPQEAPRQETMLALAPHSCLQSSPDSTEAVNTPPFLLLFKCHSPWKCSAAVEFTPQVRDFTLILLY